MSKLLLSLLLIVSSSISSAPLANAAECPKDWGYKLPELRFDSKVKTLGQFQETFFTSTLGPTKSGGLIGKNPQLFSPLIQAKIDALGPNIAMNTKYVTSTKSFVQTKYNGGYGDWEAFGYPDAPSWIFLWLGISNGTEIKFELNISQKGCSDLNFTSNVFVFDNIPIAEYGFDRYFETFPNGVTGRVLNFQELEAVKKSVLNNIKVVEEKSRAGEVTSLNVVRTDAGYGANYLIVGLAPGGCASGRNTNSAPTVNPSDVEVLAIPCKFGVLMPFEYPGGGGFTLISSHSISKGLKQPTSAKDSGAKKLTITCVKGKSSKKVSGFNPKCPSGYKKK